MAEATTNKAFGIDVHLAKTAWITGKLQDKNVIIDDLNALYHYMVADRSWMKVSSANSKIITLTTQVNGLKQILAKKTDQNNNWKTKDTKNPPKGKKEDRKT